MRIISFVLEINKIKWQRNTLSFGSSLWWMKTQNMQFVIICNTCQAKVSRGGSSTKSYTTTNLVSHLTKHPDINTHYSERKAAEETPPRKETCKRKIKHQLSIQEAQELSKPWDINDTRSQHVHKRIGKMLAVDCQPLWMVEDVGFKRVLQVLEPHYKCPSRKYCTDTIEEVSKLIGTAKYISFTTDLWSSRVNITSLLSLTAHWIDDAFVKVSAVLHAQAVEESHTGEHVAAQMEQMLQNWEIPCDKVHIVISDNASNMVKAMNDASFTRFGCFARSLQLVVKDGLFV